MCVHKSLGSFILRRCLCFIMWAEGNALLYGFNPKNGNLIWTDEENSDGEGDLVASSGTIKAGSIHHVICSSLVWGKVIKCSNFYIKWRAISSIARIQMEKVMVTIFIFPLLQVHYRE